VRRPATVCRRAEYGGGNQFLARGALEVPTGSTLPRCADLATDLLFTVPAGLRRILDRRESGGPAEAT